MSRKIKAQVVLELLDKITAPAKKVLDSVGKLDQELTKTQTELANLQKNQAGITAFSDLKKQSKITEKALQEKQQQVAALARELKSTDKPTKALKREFDQARQSAKKLKTTLSSQKQQLRELRQGLNAAGVSTRKLQSGKRALAQQVELATLKLKKYERQQDRLARKEKARLKLIGMQTKALGILASAYVAGRMVGNAAEVDEVGIRLKTVINSLNVERDMLLARRHARDLARNTLAGETETLEINYALSSAGLDAATARLGSELVHKVATVTSGVPERVGEVVGVVYNNMAKSIEGTAEEKLNRIGDILTKTQLKFQIRDFGQLGESFSEGAKGAIKYQVSLDQTAAVLGAFNSAGVQGSSAGTAFNATLRQMSRASDELGFSIVRGRDGQLDMIETLENLRNSLDKYGNDVDAKGDALQKAFGDEGSGIALLIQDMDKLRAGFKDVAQGSKGVVDSSYLEFLESSKGQTKQLTNNLQVLSNVFFGALLPGINSVLTPITAVVRWVGVGLERFPLLAQVLGIVAGSLAVAGTAVGVVTAATWAWNAALAANPIIWIIAGVAALVAGIYLLAKHWETVWAAMKAAVVSVFTFLFEYSPIGLLLKGISKVKDVLGGLFGGDDERSYEVTEKDKQVSTLIDSVASNDNSANQPSFNDSDNILPFASPQIVKSTVLPRPPSHESAVQKTEIHSPITVNAAPGMSEERVAEIAAGKIHQLQLNAERRSRGRLHGE